MKTVVLQLALCLAPSTAAIAQTCSKQSPPHTVALLELYTSEGCSSCPPADRAIGALRAAPAASATGIDRLVPLALHVDYWDGLGWKDPFGSPLFGERQRRLAMLAGTRTVYTPEVFVAGRELRNWSGGLAEATRRINAQPARADIGIALTPPQNGQLAIEVKARARGATGADLYVALVENGLRSAVAAGENGGATLRHEFVARQWIGPIALTGPDGGRATLARTIALPAGARGADLGVAAFVQDGRGDVLQALALPLCGA